jgi:hypothetical protein
MERFVPCSWIRQQPTSQVLRDRRVHLRWLVVSMIHGHLVHLIYVCKDPKDTAKQPLFVRATPGNPVNQDSLTGNPVINLQNPPLNNPTVGTIANPKLILGAFKCYHYSQIDIYLLPLCHSGQFSHPSLALVKLAPVECRPG